MECPRLEDESDGISIKNIGGVFLVIAIGTGLSLITFVFEYYYYKIRPQRNSQAYKVGENTAMSRLESEISLDSVKIQQSDGDIRVKSVSLPSPRGSKSLFKRKSSSANPDTAKELSNGHANGHTQNGIINSIFTYENAEYSDSRTELFPGLQEDKDTYISYPFSEKL